MTIPQGLAYDPHPTRPTWTCAWCAAPLANDVIQHRSDCTWITRLLPSDLRLENERLRHDLLDAQTARDMAEAELRQANAVHHEYGAVLDLLRPAREARP